MKSSIAILGLLVLLTAGLSGPAYAKSDFHQGEDWATAIARQGSDPDNRVSVFATVPAEDGPNKGEATLIITDQGSNYRCRSYDPERIAVAPGRARLKGKMVCQDGARISIDLTWRAAGEVRTFHSNGWSSLGDPDTVALGCGQPPSGPTVHEVYNGRARDMLASGSLAGDPFQSTEARTVFGKFKLTYCVGPS